MPRNRHRPEEIVARARSLEVATKRSSSRPTSSNSQPSTDLHACSRGSFLIGS